MPTAVGVAFPESHGIILFDMEGHGDLHLSGDKGLVEIK
jgi:hypothetical protein